MRRGEEYDWSGMTELPERQMICGFCGENITTRSGYTGWMRNFGEQVRVDIYICHACSGPNYFNLSGKQFPIFKDGGAEFSEAVKEVSPKFVEIYHQSQLAESDGLDEIAGPGYGKALEFLVKDYLVKNLPDEAENLKKLNLYNCIHDKLDNPKIKALADRARVIRNDETHYERKYEQSDVNDLKKLINATAAWIELEAYTAEATQT